MSTAETRHVWRDMLVRSWRLDGRMAVLVVLLTAAQVGAFATTAVAVRMVIDRAARGDSSGIFLPAILGGIGFAMWGIGAYVRFELRSSIAERVGFLQVDPEMQRTVAELEDLEHLERPDHLDNVTKLRGKGVTLAKSGWWVLETAALVCQVLVTVLLLATVHPAMLLFVLLGGPVFLLSHTAHRARAAGGSASAENIRLERHLHELATGTATGTEIRVSGTARLLLHRADTAWREAGRTQTTGRLRAAMLNTTGSIVWVAGYCGALVLTVYLVAHGRASVGDLTLVVILGGQLRGEFAEVHHMYTHAVDGLALAKPYRWLLDHARARRRQTRSQAPPVHLRQGLRLRDVTFQYPGSERQVLGPLNVDLPAGAVVAIVGAKGAGKTTLVKLLCKFHQPSSGNITVDGVDLCEIDTAAWRTAISATFQDFVRYEVSARQAVGFGDLPALEDDDRVLAAIRQADAEEMARDLPQGLETQLGDRFGGVNLSPAQWQQVALARGAMRQDSVLVVLDQPAASLDAPSERAVFLRQAARAQRLAAMRGTVTLLVSHRFTTVPVADLVLVLEDGRVVEAGSHEELVTAGGTYATLHQAERDAYAS